MGLKYKNLNGKIVLSRKYNIYFVLIWKIVKIAFRNESDKLFFQRDALIALKNKIIYNFHIINPNGMNQSFTCREKYDQKGKK